MSNDIDDGGQAYPMLCNDLGGDILGDDGMSLRDYFAGQALTGMCANTDWTDEGHKRIAENAYMHADVMLKARKGDNDE